MSKIGEVAGVNIYLSPEQYKEYKGTLNKQIEELQMQLQQKENIIKEVREIFKYYGNKEDIVGYANYTITGESLLELLEILDKGE